MKNIPLFIVDEDDGDIHEYEGHKVGKGYLVKTIDSKGGIYYRPRIHTVIFENRPDAIKQQIKQHEAFIKQTETKLNEVKERLEKLRGEFLRGVKKL